MKKSLNILVCILSVMVIIALAVVGFSNSAPSGIEPWSEKDFSLWDSDGREIAYVTMENDFIMLWSYIGAETYRGVHIGMRGMTAVDAYKDLILGYAVISDGKGLRSELSRFDKDVDIGARIIHAAEKGVRFNILFMVNPEMKPIDIMEETDGAPYEGPNWTMMITIENEIVTNVSISRKL